jgi:polyhydroxyalkanoate synthesis regulator protein
VLRKYRNRRIYDTELSRYITIDEIRDRIVRGEDIGPSASFKSDTRTITTDALIEVILRDAGAGRGPSPQLLREFIRGYSEKAGAEAAAKARIPA